MPYKVIEDKPADFRERLFLPEVLRGVGIIAKQFWRNFFLERDANPDILLRKTPSVTIQYPEEKQPYPPGYRGLHRLVPREDGKPRCVACYMCATVCPAQCIYIEAEEVEGDPIEKFPRRFIIDELRCVVCGFCVEACPKDAIRMDTGEHAPPTYTRQGQLLDEKALLRGPPVSYQYDPWLRRGATAVDPKKLEEMRQKAKPFPSGASDELSETPGFSVRQLAAEAKGRGA